ncbi:hypothetical protein [Halobellus captivus]|uniref:hypothetical protein n=1 Tax=Halobellus captivus TaxID=2592614 RepID=UPI0011A7CB91|nr:hypothetical protein [Halobellus captivus]
MTVLDRFRRPEYTGANRCRACTVVNVVVLVAVAAVVGVWTPGLGLAVALVGLLAIWLRGYLLPYTPQFAPRIAERLPGSFFGHSRRSDTLGDVGGVADTAATDTDDAADDGNGDATAEHVLEALVAASVVVVDDERLEPENAFASSWRAEMASLADRSDVALTDIVTETVANADSTRVEGSGSDVFLVVTGSGGSTTWLRRPVALAEVGALRALAETDVPERLRAQAAYALCAFLDTCPECGDELVESRPDDCCGHTVPDLDGEPAPVVACETCGVVFYQFE